MRAKSLRRGTSWRTRFLEGWGMEIEDLPLLVSELATNAVLHARSDFEVTVIRSPRVVRVEVFDQNTRLPSFAVAPTDAYSGRGLMLLRGLSTNWGVESHSDTGKTIWFEVATPRRLKRPARSVGATGGVPTSNNASCYSSFRRPPTLERGGRRRAGEEVARAGCSPLPACGSAGILAV